MAILPHSNQNPWTPGHDFSGTVVASSEKPGDVEFREGDEVFDMIDPKRYMRCNGSLAEFIVPPRDCVSRKPANVSSTEASGICGVGYTVVGFSERVHLLQVDPVLAEHQMTSPANGKKVLVTGGSTAAGLAMLQLAKTLVGNTSKVVNTCSPRNVRTVRQYGADEVRLSYLAR